MSTLRRHRFILNLFLTALVCLWQVGQPLLAANITWTGSTDQQWDLAGNWIGGVPDSTSDVIFTYRTPPATPDSITLAGASFANSLNFSDAYELTGGNLTLGAGGIRVDLGMTATIESLLAGTDGLVKTGGGAVYLKNSGNSYTGSTTINNGIVIIDHNDALGDDSSVVTVNGSTTRGFGGGTLVLAGGYTSGVNLTRGIALQGVGPVPAAGAALVSVGNNTVSGPLSNGTGALTAAASSVGGTLTMSDVTVNGTVASLLTLGQSNNAGVGAFAITGTLSGVGTINKAGLGMLTLAPTDTSNFSGAIKVGGGSVRVFSPLAFGSNAGVGAASTIDLTADGAVLEVRADSFMSSKNVFQRAGGSSTMFADHAIGSDVVNGVTTFGALTFDAAETTTFASRNGYGITFEGNAFVNTATDFSSFTNNMGGLLTIKGSFWNTANTTARVLTITSTGNTLIEGSILAAGAAHTVTKSGAGMLTIGGTNSTFTGNVNISQGTLGITDFGSVNNSAGSGVIVLGNATTTAGNLIIGATSYSTAAGLITSKTLQFNTTTASNAVYANQTGSNPVVINGAITRPNTTTGGIILGGSNTADNVITTGIPQVGTTGGITKNGPGTWALSGENGFTSSLTVTNGILKIFDTYSGSSRNVIQNGVTLTFTAQAVTQEAGGTFEYVGAADSASTETIGALTPTAGAITVKTTAVGGGSATLTLASLGTRGTAATLNYAGANESIIFGTTAPVVTNGIIAAASGGVAYQTFNGVDWATLAAGKVGAYTGYTLDGLSGAGAADVNYSQSVDASTSGAAAANTLKVIGGAANPTITLGGILTLTAKGLLFDNSGGSATITGSQIGAIAVETIIITNGSTPGNALTINSMIGGTTGSLTKSGSGTLVVGGLNTYTGNTNINEGTVRLSGETATLGAITTAGNVTTLRQGATLDINAAGTGQTVTIGALTGAGKVTNSGGGTVTAATLSIGSTASTAAGTFTGVLTDGADAEGNLTGVLNVIKRGTGAQSLLGRSTYTGSTTIGSTGLVTVNSMANLGQASGIGAGPGAGASDADNAANLVFNGSTGGLVYAGGVLNGALALGSVSATTDRLFTLAGTGVTLSSTATNGNSIVWSNRGEIVHGIVGPQAILFTGTSTGDNTFNPELSDSGTGLNITKVDKTGTGIWKLGGLNNSYSGATTITQGILMAVDGQGLSPNSNLVFDGGSLYSQGTLNRNIGTAAGEMRFAAAAPNTAQFSGGFLGGDSKLTVNWSGLPVWGSTVGFLDSRNGLILNGSQARAQGATTSNALSEVELAGNFSLGTVSAPAKAVTFTLAQNSAAVTLTVGNTADLVVGQSFTGTNVPSGAYIVSINSATTFTLSANTANTSGIAGTYADGGFIANSQRTIRVDDNSQTAGDYATISGIISGDAGTGLRKTGTGTLQLLGKNTYSGETNLAQGTLIVNSLGLSTDAATGTSVGTNINANLASNAVTLGNGGTGPGVLQYVGAGETSDRMIRLNTTTGNTQIHADGTGPLILTNVLNNMTAGAKNLYLRGSNTMGNMVTSSLTNNGADALSLLMDGNATWILTGNNSYSGTTSITSGAVGIGHANAFGTGTILLRNGSVFAYGQDRTVANAWATTGTTTTAVTSTFLGEHSLTADGAWTFSNTTAGHVITNSIAAGESLTLNGAMGWNALTAAATLTLNGSGTTNLNSNISGTFAVNLSYSGTGAINVGGVNSTGGATTMNSALGTMRVTGTGKLGTGNLTVSAGKVYIESVNHGVGTLSMAANTLLDIASGLTLTPTAITSTGTTLTAATISGAGTLALGASGITVTVSDNTSLVSDMVWTINTVTGSGTFIKAGAGTLDLTGVTNNNFTGSYRIDAGAILGVSTTNNLVLNGGVYAGSGTFTRSLGTGDNQVQWVGAGGGGFSAVGGDLSVTLALAPDPLVWGVTPSFVPDGAPLIFGSIGATGVVSFNHNIDLNAGTRVVNVIDNTMLTTDKAVLTGNLSNGTLNKTGNGMLELRGDNTLAGITITAGTLQFSTLSNDATASDLGTGSTVLTMSGGVLSFIGDGVANSQVLSRALNITAALGLNASGTNGATITYEASIAAGANQVNLTGTGVGNITGGIVLSGTAADVVPASGTWNFSGAASVIGDDWINNGPTSVVNLNSTGVLTWGTASTSPHFYLRNGSTVNLGADNPISFISASNLIIADVSGTAATNAFNMGDYKQSVPVLALGGVANGYIGLVTGNETSLLTVATTITLNRGSISANLAGSGAITKNGMGTVTLSGNNTGLSGATAVALAAGELVLDYTGNNFAKLREATAVTMSGGTLVVNGGILDNTAATVGGLTVSSGANEIRVNGTAGNTSSLAVGSITRAASGGTLTFVPGLNGTIKTALTGANSSTTGLLGTGTAYATVVDGSGTNFAMADASGNIVSITSNDKNDATTWVEADNIADSGVGFTGTFAGGRINSLRFDASTSSIVNVDPLGILSIASGGILQTSNVTGGTSGITGGRLASGTGELVVITNSPSQSLSLSSYISGAASVITKAGPGTLLLNGVNHSSSAINLQNGVIQVSGGSAIGDRSTVTLADDHFNTLELLSNETIGALAGGSATAGLNTLAEVKIGTHTLTLNSVAATSYSGLISGSGRLVKSGASAATFVGVNSFTGDLIINQGQINLTNRTIANFTNVGTVTLNAGSLVLDFTDGTEGSPDKIRNGAPVTLINTGSMDGLRANNNRNDASKAETIGVLTLLGGSNTVTLQSSGVTNLATATTARQMTITAASIQRNNRSTLLVRGNNVGALAASMPDPFQSGRLVSTALPALSGGTGAAGTTTIGIVPWAIGDSVTSGTTYGNGSSFVTAVATTGFRLLDLASEYEQMTATGGTTLLNNVRWSSATNLTLNGSAKTMNALLVDNTGALTLTLNGAGGSLLVNSGAFLFTGAQPVNVGGFSGITTGSTNEYIMHVTNTSVGGITVTSPFISSSAAFTKSGAGTLVLEATGSAYTGVTTINQGVLQIDSLNKLGNNGSGGIMINGGTLRFGAAFDPSVRTLTFGVPATSQVEITSGATLDTGVFNVTFANSVGNGGNGGMTKLGEGRLTLNAPVNYTGNTAVLGGTLAYGVSNALPTTTNLTLGAATLDIGAHNTTLKTLTVDGANAIVTGTGSLTVDGDVTNNNGSRILTLNNTGGVTLDGDYLFLSESATARTFTVNGSANVTVNGVVTDGGAAASNLTYSGTGTLTLNSINTYAGITSIDGGTVVFSTDQNLLGALRFGSTNTVTTPGILDLTNSNATFGGTFTVLTNSTSANEVKIGATKTLTVNNNVSLGSTAANSNSLTNFTGGGRMVVTSLAAGASFVVGGAASNTTVVDMSGLSSLNVSLNTTNGVLRVNPVSTTNVSGKSSTFILPATGAGTTTVTAATLAVGDSGTNNVTVAPFDQINSLQLGSGVNTFNVNTVNIGTGSRDAGSITFNSASTNGSIVIRDATGSGRAVFNMGTGTSGTGAGAVNTFDVSGHDADLLLGAVNIGTQAGRTSSLTSVFSFDQGILDMSSLILSSKGSAGATVTTSTFNIGGGTVRSGLITMATTTTATGVAIANLNITGGNVTMSGNIVKGGGLGNDTANFLMTGSNTVLDMGGNTLGGAGEFRLDSVMIESGTLKNVSEFNGGDTLVKTTAGTLTFDGTNTYTGNTALNEGDVIAVGGADNRLGTAGLSLGSGTVSATLQLGNSAGASSQTVTSLSTAGTGTANAIVSGNAAYSTLTVNQSVNTTFNGSLGGSGLNQNNLNFVKAGAGELVISGARTYTGSTVVSGGKLFIDGFGGLSNTMTSLTLGDNTEFAMRGTSPSGNVVYNFSGTGDVITVGNGIGGTLGFALDGLYNTQLNLAAGQTLKVDGTLTTAIYVNNAPTAGNAYVLINGATDGSIFGSAGSFNFAPVVFNGGSFTYALSQDLTGVGERWVLTPTAQAAAENVWWKGDLTGIATGVWSASLTTGTGAPTNWDTSENGGVDALVPPDSGSIVHFSATGAGNFATTLGANLTIRELFFHAGGTAISIGSSGGTNTLTLGNAVNSSGLTMLAGAPNVSFSANVELAKSQSWNITDLASILTISGNLGGTGLLTVNDALGSMGTLVFTGPNGRATLSGGIHLVAGKIILEGGNDEHMSSTTPFTLGSATTAATLQLGDAVNGASNNTIGSLSSSSTSGNSIVGGGAAVSTLTVVQTANDTFHGVIGGAGTNQNNIALTKQGTGTLILNGINTYTGVTTVNDGTLQVGSLGSFSGGLLVSASSGKTAILDVNGRPLTLSSITFGGADGTSTSQIIDSATGGVITLGGNVLYDGINNPLGASMAVGLNLGAAARTFTANESTNALVGLTVTGAITTVPGTTGVGLVLDGTGTGTLGGPVTLASGSTDGSTADLTKNGVGTWNINNAVTVGDDYLVNGGTVNVNAGGSLTWNASGSTSQDLLLDSSATTVNLNTANAVVGNGTANDIYIRDGSTLVVNAAGAIGGTIENMILGDNNQGIGNLVMNYDSALNNGTLQLGADSSGEVGNITGTGTLSGLLTLNLNNGMASANLAGTTGNIIKDHTTTMILSGSNNLGTGNTTVREGLLNLDFTNNNAADSKIGTGNLTMGILAATETAAILKLTGNATGATLQTVTNLAVAGGPSEIQLISNGGQDTVLRIAGTLSRTNGTVNFNLPGVNTRVEYTGASTNTNGIVGGWMTYNNNDFAMISGGQIVAATYTAANSASTWGVNENITNTAGITGTTDSIRHTINSLRFDATEVSIMTIGDTLTVGSGGIIVTGNVGANGTTITGGSLMAGTNGFIFHQHNTAGLLTVASNLVGGSNVTKNGNGVMLLTGSNVTGTINIDEGVIRVSGGNAISDTSTVNFRNAGATGLDVVAGAANSETIGSIVGSSTSSTIAIGTGATLTLNQNAAGTFVGVISGAGNLVKNGTATLTMSGDTSYTGTLTINGGRITMNGGSGAINDVSAYVINGGEFHSLQDQSGNEDRIRNTTATITLNNTGGTNGLWVENTYTTTAGARVETIGTVNLGFGANVITATPTVDNAAATAEFAAISYNQGANHSTLLVRGLNLGSSATVRKGLIRSTTLVANVGGGGAANSKNISIVPWAIGDLSSTGLGNSLVTFVSAAQGFRPLASGEYTTDAAGFNGLTNGVASTDNVRFAVNPAGTLTSTATAINALVFDATANITVTGPANGIEITSGAILAANTGAHTLAGFGGGITTGGGRDYIVSVTNSATQNFTISAQLASAVSLVKSGAGILTLTNALNAFTDVYMNQGLIAVDDLDKLGTGNLMFHGGGIRLAATFADDLSSKTWSIGTGGGVIDVSLVSAGAVFANGIDDSTAGSNDVLTIRTRSVATGIVGELTIQGSSSFTGTTLFANSGINGAVTNSVVLNGDTNTTLNGNVELGDLVNVNNTFDVVMALGKSEQIVDSATITFRAASGENAYFKLMGFTETVAGLIGLSRDGVIENVESSETGVTTNGKLIVAGSGDYLYAGYMRNRGSGSNVQLLEFEKQGTGTQTFSGDRITYTGQTTVTAGTLRLTDTTAFASSILNNAILDINTTAPITWTSANAISGSGSVMKTGPGTFIQTAENTYAGDTRIMAGTMMVNNLTGSGTGTGNVFVTSLATLGGFGRISGTVTVADSGILSPGTMTAGVSAIGQLTVGTLMANTGSSLFFNIGGTTIADLAGTLAYQADPDNFIVPESWTPAWTSATLHDQLKIEDAGVQTINGTISAVFETGYSPVDGDIFHLVDWASLGGVGAAGTLAGIQGFNLPVLNDGLTWNTNLFVTHGIVFVVPEPGRMLLLCIGLLGLFYRRRRH